MHLHIREGDIHLLDIRTRMPFKYGIATMTSTPHAFVRLRVEVDGTLATGIAADHLPPKWFTKDPARGLDDEVDEMLRVIAHAVATATGQRGPSAVAVWRLLYDAQATWGQAEGLPPLLAHFGTSLVERALLDAVCRSLGQPFAQLVRGPELGLWQADGRGALPGMASVDLLPAQPLRRVLARHTVGMADPLFEADITTEERLADGLPQSLEACIEAYGLRHFKIKVSGDLPRDRERLRRVAEVLARHAPADFRFSLDGNEQFHAPEVFRDFWESLTRESGLQAFFAHLLFVEQPFHRQVALDPAAMAGFLAWTDRPATIIDESDGELESLEQALRLGYAGTSHKNCKGVFKGVANACRIAGLRREFPDRLWLLSGEDLANIGPVALLQDLAVAAVLGVASIERNGHHYFTGLSMFPRRVQEQMLSAHGDLYRPSRDGWPTLRIADGALDLHSVLAAPFGVAPLIDVEPYTPHAAWGRASSPK